MKTTVNCFIPFMGAAQAEQTIKNLKASDLVSKIYLLVTDNVEDSIDGCEKLQVPSLNSTVAAREIASHSDADYSMIYTKYTTLELGMFALERMLHIAEDSDAGMLYADHYQVIGETRTACPVIDYQLPGITGFPDNRVKIRI